MPNIRLGSISLDCADPLALGSFWADLLGGEIAYSSEEFVAVQADRIWLTAVRIPDFAPPTWPEGGRPKQMHLDLAVDHLDQAETEAVGLGAVPAADQTSPERFRVFFDPAGHPFCLSTQIPE
jgi:hypothetical protein